MKNTMTTSTVNGAFVEKLEWLWSMMDISDSLKKAYNQSLNVGNDIITGLMHLLAFAALTLVMGALAWHFDLESTIIGISTLQNSVIPGLPSSAQAFSIYIGVGFSLAPTLIEIFTAAFARAQIKILQLMVVGLTAFDMVTDIPRAIAFTNSMDTHFYQLGLIFGFIAKYSFFLFWLFLCTIGFELTFVIFAYLTGLFFFKSLGLWKGRPQSMKSTVSVPSKPNKPTVIIADE